MRPPGLERDAKRVTANLDKGIELNLDAALIQNDLQLDVKHGVTTGVVTLTGQLDGVYPLVVAKIHAMRLVTVA